MPPVFLLFLWTSPIWRPLRMGLRVEQEGSDKGLIGAYWAVLRKWLTAEFRFGPR